MLRQMTEHEIAIFQQTVWRYYDEQGRHDLPWRLPEADGAFDPYKIVVSEVMLQQTQVPRVLPKFGNFVRQFPDVSTLAAAPLSDVLRAWNGLGYNRRAKFLWQAAQAMERDHGGSVPQTLDALVALPGIGRNTAGAVLAYAHNAPVIFIETNIRTVFIHHFFSDRLDVADTEIRELVASTLPQETVRSWYWALMDYGTYLKQTVGNASRKSKTYAKQGRFEGSRRQIRGRVLRLLGEKAHTKAQLVKYIADDRLDGVLADLEREGFIVRRGRVFRME